MSYITPKSKTLYGLYQNRDPADIAGRTHYPSDSVYIERDDGSDWIPYGPISPFTPPVEADFTWVNQGGATVDYDRGGAYLFAPAVAGAQVRMQVKAQPTPPYTIEGAFIPNIVTVNGVFPGCGLMFRESGTSKIITFSYTTANSPPIWVPQKWTNETTFSANYLAVWGGGGVGGNALDYFSGLPIRFQIRHITTHLQFWVSSENRLWHQIYQDVVADFFTSGPDQVGFFAFSNTASYDASMWLLHWAES